MTLLWNILYSAASEDSTVSDKSNAVGLYSHFPRRDDCQGRSARMKPEYDQTTINNAQKLTHGTPNHCCSNPTPVQAHRPNRMAMASSARSILRASSASRTGCAG